jgi:O-methyltransferase
LSSDLPATTQSLFSLPSARFIPLCYRAGGVGNWSGHLPFARDLIDALRPSTIVELGTHFGESYFGFCQSVAESGVPAKTFAVDTWCGDQHTGPYGDEVFASVCEANQCSYAGFSRLLRMSFDEAASLFAPETIDLLHLDGAHTYDAVRHDFEVWFPKLRPGGIVLIHDTAVETADFGVRKLWDELSQIYPAFAFLHSCGLGVIQKPGGGTRSPLLAGLFEATLEHESIRRYYELCADRLESRYLAGLAWRDAEFDCRMQLYWRQVGQSFAEARSIPKWARVGRKPSTLVFALPPMEPPPEQLRLDAANPSCVLRISRIELADTSGSEIIWNPQPGSIAGAPAYDGGEMSKEGEDLLLHVSGSSFTLLLPIDPNALEKLRESGELRLDVSASSFREAAASLMKGRSATPWMLYLDLLKRCLTRTIFPDGCVDTDLKPTGLFDLVARENGQDWPAQAETMIGWKRLSHLEECVTEALRQNIPGDLVETGVWRGGASILMRAVLKAHGDRERQVWLFDSFEGLPTPNPAAYPPDKGDDLSKFNAYLGVSLDTVRENFDRYGLLDGQVQFIKGWFNQTIPDAAVESIAVLRLDGDMYESTIQVLDGFYDKVSPGGFVIVDDYGALETCRAAVHDFRTRRGITAQIEAIDWTGVFWRK